MDDCVLTPAGSRFRCYLCGWEYHRGDVRRNCPATKGGTKRPPIDDLAARLRAKRLLDLCKYDDVIIEARLATCRRCDRFNAEAQCCRSGGCTSLERYVQRLTLGECERWNQDG